MLWPLAQTKVYNVALATRIFPFRLDNPSLVRRLNLKTLRIKKLVFDTKLHLF